MITKKIILAESAGFCFGVNRAVNMVNDLINKNESVCTLGSIIHNKNLINDLKHKGCRIVENPNEINNETLVIRSHGVGSKTYDLINELNIKMVDATCPYVFKIHKTVEKYSDMGYNIIIAGDKTHPEVEGTIGHCKSNVYCFMNLDELSSIVKKLANEENTTFIMVAQTTFNKNIWENSVNFIKTQFPDPIFFDTICSATAKRQEEALKLSQMCDLMVVIGDKSSSNTNKLLEISRENCKAILIENASEINEADFITVQKIGVTAGASTPAYIIKEAIHNMEEILQNNAEEMDFAQLLEQSLETEKLYNGKRVTGIVTTITNNEIHVDINAKQAGIVHIDELTDDPSLKIDDIVKKGDEIELVVLKVNDQEGIVTLSKKRCDAQAGFEKIKEAAENNEVIDGFITDVVRGGVLVFALGTKVFVPASQVSLSRVEKLETLLRKPCKIKILEVNEKRGRALASIKAVLNEERKALQGQFWDEVAIDKTYTGEIKSLTQYGAFVDLGGVDGMIHITELAWTRIKHPSEIVKVGETVEVYIKDLDKEKKRISLGYKRSSDNPWEIFKNTYNVEDEVSVTIVSFTNYGAFARIIPGIDGLIHISQIANQRVEKISEILKIGQVVQAKIIDINLDEKRVSLSMRALLSDDEQKREAEEAAQEAEANLAADSGEAVVTEEETATEE